MLKNNKDGKIIYSIPGLTIWYSNLVITEIKSKLNSKIYKGNVKLVEKYLKGQ